MARLSSRFVGRESELRRLRALFTSGVRLVTITGGPGQGKTRLARQYQASPVCEVGAGALVPALARTLELPLPDELEDDGLDYLADWLAPRERLVVLDNVIGPTDVARLIARAPRLQLLVTAREPMHLAGEEVLALPGLAAHDAVQLFLDRAAGFVAAPTAGELRDVQAIVERLDGIPLAIELAAGLLVSLELSELAARVSQSAGWLDRVSGNGVLQAALLESWERLSAAERLALVECASFVGGFSAEAAEAVLSGGVALAMLGRLIEKSLVYSYLPGPDGRRRFDLYHAVRELIVAQTGGERDDELALRHARYVVTAGRILARQVTRTGDSQAQQRLALERENLLSIAASEYAPELRLEAIVVLDPILRGGEPHADHRDLLDRGVALAREVESLLLGELVAARGELGRRRGAIDAALADFAEAVRLADVNADSSLLGRVMAFQAMIHHQAGRLAEAEELSHAAIARNRQDGDSRSERISRVTLGLVLLDEDRGPEARAVLEETLVLAEDARDRFIQAMSVSVLSRLPAGTTRLDERRAQLQRGRALAVELGDRRTEGLITGWHASLEHAAGEGARARAGYLESIALLHASNGYRFEGLFRGRLAALLADLDLLDDAVEERDRAAGIFRRVGDPALDQSLRLHEGHLELLYARRARALGTPDADHLARVAQLVALPCPTYEVRWARELLVASLRGTPEASGLVVEKGGLRFRLEGNWVSLVRRRTLGRLLVALTEATPGEPVSIAALIAHGWPGETLAGDSGVHRVRMAVATLRKLGLKDVLLTAGDGYLLDPAISVRVL